MLLLMAILSARMVPPPHSEEVKAIKGFLALFS